MNHPIIFYHAFLAINTLARAGELRALLWSDIDFERGFISISKTCDPKSGLKNCPKNGEARLVPISPETKQVLLELKERTYTCDTDLVLPHWREFADGEQGKPLKLILRATGITLMLNTNMPHIKVMKISGHRSLSSFTIYIRLAGVDITGATDHITLLEPLAMAAKPPIEHMETTTTKGNDDKKHD